MYDNFELAYIYGAYFRKDSSTGIEDPLIKQKCQRIMKIPFSLTEYYHKHNGTLNGIGVGYVTQQMRRKLEVIIYEEAKREMNEINETGQEPDLNKIPDFVLP